MSNFQSRAVAPPLPITSKDLLAQRKTLRTRTLNDDVDQIHLILWDDQGYQRYFLPIWRSESVEGSFIADDVSAAIMVREYAKNNRLPLAAGAKLDAIVHSLHVVTRRYGISRKERQHMVAGETVDGNESEE